MKADRSGNENTVKLSTQKMALTVRAKAILVSKKNVFDSMKASMCDTCKETDSLTTSLKIWKEISPVLSLETFLLILVTFD